MRSILTFTFIIYFTGLIVHDSQGHVIPQKKNAFVNFNQNVNFLSIFDMKCPLFTLHSFLNGYNQVTLQKWNGWWISFQVYLNISNTETHLLTGTWIEFYRDQNEKFNIAGESCFSLFHINCAQRIGSWKTVLLWIKKSVAMCEKKLCFGALCCTKHFPHFRYVYADWIL